MKIYWEKGRFAFSFFGTPYNKVRPNTVMFISGHVTNNDLAFLTNLSFPERANRSLMI